MRQGEIASTSTSEFYEFRTRERKSVVVIHVLDLRLAVQVPANGALEANATKTFTLQNHQWLDEYRRRRRM
jgi:hypothetical protein